MKHLITASFYATLLMSCATTLLMDSSINEFLLMGIKTNSNDNVILNYSSNVVDGKHVPFKKGKIPPSPGQMGFNHTESYTLKRMAEEYLSMRFLNINKQGGPVVNLTLKDFWVEQGAVGTLGEQLLSVGKFEVAAHIDAIITVTINESTETKIIKIHHSEQTDGLAGAIWQKQISVCINKVNNKLLMGMSQFLETCGI